MAKGLTYMWFDFLQLRGIYVDSDSVISRADALTCVLLREYHISALPRTQGMKHAAWMIVVAQQEETKKKNYKPSGKDSTPINTSRKSLVYPKTYITPHSLPNTEKIERYSMAENSSAELDLETEYQPAKIMVIEQ